MAINKPATKRRKLARSISHNEEQKSHDDSVATPDRNGRALNPSLPSVKDLASSDPKLRRQNLAAILSFLEVRSADSPLTYDECLQLWRGFHVTLYMHDSKNALSVQQLIATLAGTFPTLNTKDDERSNNVNSRQKQKTKEGEAQSEGNNDDEGSDGWLTAYSNAFWETMAREWGNIDSHRLNKYLLLIRFVVREIFKICFASQQHEEQIRQPAVSKTVKNQLDIFEAWPLNGRERRIGDGLRMHVLDVWNNELFVAKEALESKIDENGEDIQPTEEEKETKKKSTRKGGDNGKKHATAALMAEEKLQRAVNRRKRDCETLTAFMRPLQKLGMNDSGAQKHLRQRARDTLEELEKRTTALKDGRIPSS